MNRSEKRSWFMHTKLSEFLTGETLVLWKPWMLKDIAYLKKHIRGEPHQENILRWEKMIRENDVASLRKVFLGTDRDAIKMREVSPMKRVYFHLRD
jgi:hypothetical protein